MQHRELQYLGSLMVMHLIVFFPRCSLCVFCVRARRIPGKAVKHKGELVRVSHEVHSLLNTSQHTSTSSVFFKPVFILNTIHIYTLYVYVCTQS